MVARGGSARTTKSDLGPARAYEPMLVTAVALACHVQCAIPIAPRERPASSKCMPVSMRRMVVGSTEDGATHLGLGCNRPARQSLVLMRPAQIEFGPRLLDQRVHHHRSIHADRLWEIRVPNLPIAACLVRRVEPQYGYPRAF